MRKPRPMSSFEGPLFPKSFLAKKYLLDKVKSLSALPSNTHKGLVSERAAPEVCRCLKKRANYVKIISLFLSKKLNMVQSYQGKASILCLIFTIQHEKVLLLLKKKMFSFSLCIFIPMPKCLNMIFCSVKIFFVDIKNIIHGLGQ